MHPHERGAIGRRLLFAMAALAAAVLVFAAATLPARSQQIRKDAAWSTRAALIVAGALHVHTDRSDGTASIEEVAAAASRAGLQFLVLADHGDGTRTPVAPAYRSGVMCLDGVEISTESGHYMAVGLDAAPYPLAGEARDVAEDVRRLGGFGVAAHPESAKGELRWTDWSVPIDGLEWLNADSDWRDEKIVDLVAAALRYAFRPRETLASLFDRPDAVLRQWDRLTERRPVVALGGSDAHARIGLGGEDESEGAVLLRAPPYETSFSVFAVRLRLDAPLSRDAAKDAGAILGALRAGRAYTAIDALAEPPLIEFTGLSGQMAASYGDRLAATEAVTLTARIAQADGAELVLLRNGTPVRTSRTGELRFDTDAHAAVYRMEVRLDRSPGTPPVPWILTNPIYVGTRASAEPRTDDIESGAPAPPADEPVRSLYGEGKPEGWTLEHQADSRAAIDAERRPDSPWELRFRYALNSARERMPYAALVRRVANIVGGGGGIAFRAHADRPTRVSVQLRAPGTPEDRRWRRSVYLEQTPRDVRIELTDMRPVGATTPAHPSAADPDSLLFVIDTLNTAPGTAGVVWLSDVRIVK